MLNCLRFHLHVLSDEIYGCIVYSFGARPPVAVRKGAQTILARAIEVSQVVSVAHGRLFFFFFEILLFN